MDVLHSIEAIPPDYGPTVVSVGNFDGVHRAHQTVLKDIAALARLKGAKSVAVTFEPPPVRIIRPESGLKLLTPTPVKLRWLEKTGIDGVLLLPFGRDLSLQTPREFAEGILRDKLRAIEVHEGYNFHFGHKAAGNVAMLAEFGREMGFAVKVFDELMLRGESVSSSQIRKLIRDGRVSRARHLLGRPFAILSNAGRGRGYGSKYTVPTVNLSRYEELVPIELTAQTEVEVFFLDRIRDEIKFPSVEDLRVQIARDVHHARRYFHLIEMRKTG